MRYIIEVANEKHGIFAEEICKAIEETARHNGTGISKRTPEFVKDRISEGNAVVATDEAGNFAGFSYMKPWGREHFVYNARLVVKPEHRENGLAGNIMLVSRGYRDLSKFVENRNRHHRI